ncbi:MAG: DUF1501 domain-containing protein [Anaerolineales bacterium]
MNLRPQDMPRLAFAPPQTAPRGDVLVVIFLRGAADVLNMVVPCGEAEYYRLRPVLAIPSPDEMRAAPDERAIDLDGFFGLHPAMRPLMGAWQAKHLAIVHACGAPDESRSHFQAMALMERGVTDTGGPASGWIGRHLAVLDTGNASPLRAIGLGARVPRSLYGTVSVTALRSLADFRLGEAGDVLPGFRAALDALYAGDTSLSGLGRETLAMLDTLGKIPPSSGSAYPDSAFGAGLQQVAALIRAEAGLEAAALDLDGWDTHFAQGRITGQMPSLMADLADGLAAFHADLHAHLEHLTVVVMSEFGRRAYENASLGTDHGHGSAIFVLGGHVHGGQVHGRWPGLAEAQLFEPGDLAVTTDYRDVLGEVLIKRLNDPALDVVFPGYAVQFPGVVY